MSGTVVIATRNQGKVREFAALFAERGYEVKSLNDFDRVRLPDIVEDGTTFAENAIKKARTIAEALGIPVIADDSGLCVDALDGEPGVYSARYAGEHASDADNNAKLLRELAQRGKPYALLPDGHPRVYGAARFIAHIAMIDPQSGQVVQAEGGCEGYIITEPRGSDGFGYDPLFYLPEHRCTMAELSLAEKNRISHRARALAKLADVLI